jgi:hypothetical protein
MSAVPTPGIGANERGYGPSHRDIWRRHAFDDPRIELNKRKLFPLIGISMTANARFAGDDGGGFR